jgi:adenylosuccinate lyase
MKENIADVLAERYASRQMTNIWSPCGKVRLMRQLWVAALDAQRDAGLNIPRQAIEAYRASIGNIDLASIAARELTTKHDVKANIEEFNALAGGVEYVHLGFTSRDITDNVEQLQILWALELVRDRTVAVLRRLGVKAAEFAALNICGRSHNIPGQTTTLGKRFGNLAEELLCAFSRLEELIATYPLRGIKGPMGTQQDMLALLGSSEKVSFFEKRMREHLGIPHVLGCVGQVYPRSMDFDAVSVLVHLASAPVNFANMIRLMAGHELAYEGFAEGQSGSSAMPHKMNSRTCERISGLLAILGGFLDMTRSLAGNQWFEGDVSCSVVRRVALPGAFFAIDGIYESVMTVLDQMKVFPGAVRREMDCYLPFLSTTRFLMGAVQMGMGREAAHAIIKKHALAAIRDMRDGLPNRFIILLGDDEDFPLGRPELEALLFPDHGLAGDQVEEICGRITEVVNRHPKAARYEPEPIL